MQRREFTIERQMRRTRSDEDLSVGSPEIGTNGFDQSTSQSELMEEVRALRGEIAEIGKSLAALGIAHGSEGGVDGEAADGSVGESGDGIAGSLPSAIVENDFLRREIARMVRSMAQAKEQIAAIKHPEIDDNQVNAASNELHAIVSTTEMATNTILEMGEGVQQLAERLMNLMGSDEDVQSTCSDIITRINTMFEACNFQDITGQRVTKVVTTLEFIEERLRTIIDAWGKEAFADIPIPQQVQLHETDDLVSGPALGDSGLSQDEIDSLFG
ncbi:MAG: hypothetical protein AAFW60_06020 [Pseudomonadota bacterium]